jgi:hypothetical protein
VENHKSVKVPEQAVFVCVDAMRCVATGRPVAQDHAEGPHGNLIDFPGALCCRASHGHLGRPDEARAHWQELLQINPNYSIEHRREVLPYKNPADFDPFADGLQKAGLME